MRQINANTIIIPILIVEETMLGNLLAQNEMAFPWRRQDSALSAFRASSCTHLLATSWEGHDGALEQLYLPKEESVTGKRAPCRMCLGEVWDLTAPIFLSIHHP